MTKADIFVADAHIKDMDDACAVKFISFLEQIKDSTRTLYILGDLFDFWFGGNKASFNQFRSILDKLKELSDASVKIVYLEGNHDFFMGSFFTDTLKASVYADDAKLKVDGREFYLTHGDTINYNDKRHLLWRRVLRSNLLFFIMKTLPAGILLKMAEKLSKTSRNAVSNKKVMKKEIIEEFITQKHNEGFFAVIYAHTHIPVIEENSGKFSVNPGDFSYDGSYVKYENGTFSPWKF